MTTPQTTGRVLRLLRSEAVIAARSAIDAEALAAAAPIVEEVRQGGLKAAVRHAVRLGDIEAGASPILDRETLLRALTRVSADERTTLERTADRIRAFALAQRSALSEVEVAVPGGRAGHRLLPLQRAGCYAPGGRHPLPSSVLMTAVTAKAAGVEQVWLASPRPAPATLAAAAIADADGLLAIGGAQAIGLLAYGDAGGDGPPACDIVVGPGNRFVTAAKHIVSRDVAIDMLAGPSELVIIADESGDAGLIAVDLIAQAEHDVDAAAILVTTCASLADQVDVEIRKRLAAFPTAATAAASLARRGGCVLVESASQAVEVADAIAPEHLHIVTRDAEALAARVRNYGALFIGSDTPEALGDYGLGPNHVLPTGGSARHAAGLSVLTFLRMRTFLASTAGSAAAEELRRTARLADLEGLPGHAASARMRLPQAAPVRTARIRVYPR